MALTVAQLTTLKAAILADPILASQPMSSDGATTIAISLNALAVPDYWVWRTAVSRSEIYNLTSPDGTTWNWTTYKNQGVAEQNAWTQMFMGDVADFSKVNLRNGIGSIFTGSAQANAQTAHCLSMGRRLATRIEKLFAIGTGTPASPAIMTFEGLIGYQDVTTAREL